MRELKWYMGIHRHTGGLEKRVMIVRDEAKIHRHTGGLEIAYPTLRLARLIHRHTGGLEIGTSKPMKTH